MGTLQAALRWMAVLAVLMVLGWLGSVNFHTLRFNDFIGALMALLVVLVFVLKISWLRERDADEP